MQQPTEIPVSNSTSSSDIMVSFINILEKSVIMPKLYFNRNDMKYQESINTYIAELFKLSEFGLSADSKLEGWIGDFVKTSDLKKKEEMLENLYDTAFAETRRKRRRFNH